MDYTNSKKRFEKSFKAYKIISPFLINSKITSPKAPFFSSIYSKGKFDSSINTERINETDKTPNKNTVAKDLTKTMNFFNNRSSSTHLFSETVEPTTQKTLLDCVIDKRLYLNVNKVPKYSFRRKKNSIESLDHKEKSRLSNNSNNKEKSIDKHDRYNLDKKKEKKFSLTTNRAFNNLSNKSFRINSNEISRKEEKEDFFRQNEPLKIEFNNTKNTYNYGNYLFSEKSKYDKLTSHINLGSSKKDNHKSNIVLNKIYKKLGQVTTDTTKINFFPEKTMPLRGSVKSLSKKEVLEKMFQVNFKEKMSSQKKIINKLTNKETIKFRPKELSKCPSLQQSSYEKTLSSFPPKLLHCQSETYLIYDVNDSECLWSKNSKVKKEIGCLTKIMTFYTAIQMASKMNIDVNTTPMLVSQNAAMYNLKGGCLQMTNDSVDMIDLLYGMMLTSGNDAAKAVAENVGRILEESIMNERRSIKKSSTNGKNLGSGEQVFIKYMNKYARELGMDTTNFSNVHGIANSRNFSTCEDLIKLIEKAMSIHSFRQIIKTVRYSVTIKRADEPKILMWENLNKLIVKNVRGCIGIKSDFNKPSGESLATWWSSNDKHFIIIQQGCQDNDEHYKEAETLFNWGLTNLEHIRNAPLSLRNK